MQVHVPQSKWGQLNADSAWEEFGTGATPAMAGHVLAGPVHAALLVDWHAVLAWRRLQPAMSWEQIPWLLLNYRLFSRDDGAPQVLLCNNNLAMQHFGVSCTCMLLSFNKADRPWLSSFFGWYRHGSNVKL